VPSIPIIAFDKLTVNSILYKTGNLRRCSQSLMKNFNSVGASGMVCDSGLFSSEKAKHKKKTNFSLCFLCVIKRGVLARESTRGKDKFSFSYFSGSPLTDSLTLSREEKRREHEKKKSE
jgi:hypothetical protein